MSIMQDSYNAADDTISKLKELGHDYSPYREQIALAYDDGIFNGNWDWTTDIDVEGVKELRLIQEDEYDQHMDDDDDKPEWDNMLFQSEAYVWFA